MNDLHQIAAVCQPGDVLATIVRVDGSAYKRDGGVMLFHQDGTWSGLLSAGCLEEDLALRLRENIIQPPMVMPYDMRSEDDLGWGQGSGCNGTIYVLMESITLSLYEDLMRARQLWESGVAVAVVKDLSAGTYQFTAESGESFGSLKREDADRILECFLQTGKKSAYLEEGEHAVYAEVIRPKPRVTIFGAGEDARPLVRNLTAAGFAVRIADWREALCSAKYFPDAASLHLGFPAKLLQVLSFHYEDAVIVMSHNFERDKELVTKLKDMNLSYLGLLGSRKRSTRLLQTENFPANIHAPIGLPIGAEGPVQIAISITAELIAHTQKSAVRHFK